MEQPADWGVLHDVIDRDEIIGQKVLQQIRLDLDGGGLDLLLFRI